jgi:pyrroloquinoline quinone biosynthesis protein D
MNPPFPEGAKLSIAAVYRLQWEEVQQRHVLLYAEGMIALNPAAGEILKRCDGSSTVVEIISDLEAQFPDAELAADVLEFLQEAKEKRWVCTE